MVRINAILPEDTLVKIDAIVKEKKKSRSGFLREAAEKLIDEYQRQKAEEIKREPMFIIGQGKIKGYLLILRYL